MRKFIIFTVIFICSFTVIFSVNDIFDSDYKLDIENLVSGCYVINIGDDFIKFIKK